jgi:hypothetical protein
MRVEREFLEALARTACVGWAADAVGISTTAIYARRKTDAGFDGRWGEALRAAAGQIGDLLTSSVLAAFDPELAASGVPKASVSEAIAIARLKGIGKAPPGEAEEPDIEDVRARILVQIAAIKAARGRVTPGAGAGDGEVPE